MSPDELKAIRARLAKASPGPWPVKRASYVSPFLDRDEAVESIGPVAAFSNSERGDAFLSIGDEDAAFIEHAPSDVSALIAEVERLRAILKRVEWGPEHGAPICPSCGAFFADKPIHAPGCELAALLR